MIKSPFSERVREANTSPTIGLSAYIAELRNAGEEILSLNVGEPDFPPPKEVLEATHQALRNKQTRYSLVLGLPELRESIQEKLKRENQLEVDNKGILLSNGSKQSLYTIFQGLLNPGDEVLIPRPYWVSFPESVKLAGGEPVFVNTRENFQLDLDEIKRNITSKTKLILINTPNNPSGAVYPKEDLERIAEIALQNDLMIISDEAYEQFVYGQTQHTSIASLSPDIFARTLTVQSFSKSFAMTGYRLGYVTGPEEIIEQLAKLQGHLCGNSCTFAQYGALAALKQTGDFLKETRQLFEKRRNLVIEKIQAIEGIDIPAPEGAFYLFFPIHKFLNENIQTCDQMARHILDQTGVALVPGSAFGSPGYLRLSFAAGEDILETSLRRLQEVLQ